MTEIILELDHKNDGVFLISENGNKLGEMAVSKKGNILTIYHTEIKPGQKGKGFGEQLFENMLDYAATDGSMIRPLCPFVYYQFEKDPQRYSRVWLNAEPQMTK